jgi:hypothetical protein
VAGGIHPQTYMSVSPGIVFSVGVAGGIHPQTYVRISPGIVFTVGVAGGIHPQTYMRITPGIVFTVGVAGSVLGMAGRGYTPQDIDAVQTVGVAGSGLDVSRGVPLQTYAHQPMHIQGGRRGALWTWHGVFSTGASSTAKYSVQDSEPRVHFNCERFIYIQDWHIFSCAHRHMTSGNICFEFSLLCLFSVLLSNSHA